MNSISSMFVSALLTVTQRKKRLADKSQFDLRLQQLNLQGETKYQLDYHRFHVSLTHKTFQTMDYYIINAGGKSNNKVLYFHGGGFISQPVKQHWKLLDHLAQKTDTEIWVPIYPKIPFHTADDVYPLLINYYQLFIENTESKKIVLMGDSAGGNIALSLSQQIYNRPLKQVDSLVLISPFLDVSLAHHIPHKIIEKDAMLGKYGTQKCGELWAGDRSVLDPLISPLYGPLHLLADITLFSGTYDLLNLDARLFALKAQAVKHALRYVEVEKMQHVYPLLPIKEGRKARHIIEDLLSH